MIASPPFGDSGQLPLSNEMRTATGPFPRLVMSISAGRLLPQGYRQFGYDPWMVRVGRVDLEVEEGSRRETLSESALVSEG